jgi:hypothetical protein
MEAIKSVYIKAWKDYPFHSLHGTHQLIRPRTAIPQVSGTPMQPEPLPKKYWRFHDALRIHSLLTEQFID